MRSDSCADSSAELEVKKAWPRMALDSSTRKAFSSLPPFKRVIAPEAQASNTAMRTSAGIASSCARSA